MSIFLRRISHFTPAMAKQRSVWCLYVTHNC